MNLHPGGTVRDGALSSSGTFDVQAGTISAALAGTGALTKTTGNEIQGRRIADGKAAIQGSLLSQ